MIKKIAAVAILALTLSMVGIQAAKADELAKATTWTKLRCAYCDCCKPVHG